MKAVVFLFVLLAHITAPAALGADVTVEKPPIITLTERYGKPIRVGDFPVFRLKMSGTDAGGLRAFLKKDGVVLGHLLMRFRAHFTSDTVTLEWRLTRYVTESKAIRLASAGDGYQVFVGILKSRYDTVNETKFSTGAFIATDETERFTLTPPPPIVVHHDDEQINLRTGEVNAITFYVIGFPGEKYTVYSSSTLERWWNALTFTAHEEVMELAVETQGEDSALLPYGFFALEKISTASSPSVLSHGGSVGPYKMRVKSARPAPEVTPPK